VVDQVADANFPEGQDVNLIESILQTVRGSIRTGRSEAKSSERRLKKLRKLLKRYKFKGRGSDFMGDILASKVADEERNLKTTATTVATFEFALTIMADYEDLPPEEAMRRLQHYTFEAGETFNWTNPGA